MGSILATANQHESLAKPTSIIHCRFLREVFNEYCAQHPSIAVDTSPWRSLSYVGWTLLYIVLITHMFNIIIMPVVHKFNWYRTRFTVITQLIRLAGPTLTVYIILLAEEGEGDMYPP